MFSLGEILEITGGRLEGAEQAREYDGLSIDSRTIKKGELFVAIKGNRYDGHSFIRKALLRGAGAALARQGVHLSGKPDKIIRVPDTLRSLGQLACYHRLRFNIPVIAVTGSNGKTTTKEMIYHILSGTMCILRNKGTENNAIGLPLTLLRLNKNHEAAVVEMGSNHPGEMAQLCEIARPSIGIITGIGPSHLEFFRTISAVAREKLQLVSYLKSGITLLNGDDIQVKDNAQKISVLGRTMNVPVNTAWGSTAAEQHCFGCASNTSSSAGKRAALLRGASAVLHRGFCIDTHKVFFYGTKTGLDFQAENIYADLYRTNFILKIKKRFKQKDSEPFLNGRYQIKLKVPGRHNVLNALASFALTKILGLAPEQIIRRLNTFKQPQMRLCPREVQGLLIVDDTYNANPASMETALMWLSGLNSNGRKILVCADMLELGKKSEMYHYKIGLLAARSNIDFVVGYGPQSKMIILGARQAGMNKQHLRSFLKRGPAVRHLVNLARPGDILLFKGSRGMQMERLKECFITSYTP